ncbi:MAG: DUF4263 domain-containing protein [Bacteroidota bacterium]|nr:DUF4263 domain-containing protein [Bacteroidota bacterium]
MKIMLLTDKIIDRSTDLLYLQKLANLKDDILIETETSRAKETIFNSLIEFQKHIDIIIVDLKSKEDEIIEELAIWIRNKECEYSFKNFQLKSITIILYKELELWRKYRNNLFDHVIFNNTTKEQKEIYIGKSYDDWLNKLATDLDNLNLNINLSFATFDIKWMLSHRFHKLTILSANFVQFPRNLDYLWFGNNINKLDISINELDDLLRLTMRNKNLRIEKRFHQYFLNNSGIIKIDKYSLIKYEKHLYYSNSRKYIEPDFINIPYNYYLGLPEVFEVKNPNQNIHRNDGNPFSNTLKAIKQVNRKYYDYLSDPNNKQEIMKRLDEFINAFDYTLLIGRKETKEENLYNLEKLINSSKINILTYDDLIERYDQVRERIKRHRLS